MMRLSNVCAALKDNITSSTDLVERSLGRAESSTQLNALISLDRRGALEAAQESDQRRSRAATLSQFDGVPLVVKDNIATRGLRWTGGCAHFRDLVASYDAAIVKRLRDLGFIILGKSNMDELALGVTGQNLAYGNTVNALNPDVIAGGSSSGSAVSVAAEFAPVAIGTDTGGSGRIPAALNGCAGYRPTVGLFPMQGIMQLSVSRDTVSIMASDVSGVQLMLDALSGGSNSDHRQPFNLSIGIVESWIEACDTKVQHTFRHVLNDLVTTGVKIRNLSVQDIEAINQEIGLSLMVEECARFWPYFLAQNKLGSIGDLVKNISSPGVKSIFESIEAAATQSDQGYFQSILLKLNDARSRYSRLFSDFDVDVIAFPVAGVGAPKLTADQKIIVKGEPKDAFEALTRQTTLGSLTGHPGLVVPVREHSNTVSIGLGLDGPIGSDRRLILIGRSIESRLARAKNSTSHARRTTSA